MNDSKGEREIPIIAGITITENCTGCLSLPVLQKEIKKLEAQRLKLVKYISKAHCPPGDTDTLCGSNLPVLSICVQCWLEWTEGRNS